MTCEATFWRRFKSLSCSALCFSPATANMDQIIAEIRKIPPITRLLTGSSLVITIPVLMNILHGYKTVFLSELVFQKLEVSLAFEVPFFISHV